MNASMLLSETVYVCVCQEVAVAVAATFLSSFPNVSKTQMKRNKFNAAFLSYRRSVAFTRQPIIMRNVNSDG